MANYVLCQRKGLGRRQCFSICVGETTDVSSETRIAVTARYRSDATTKELVKVPGLSETSKGEDMCKAFLKTVSDFDMHGSVSVPAPSMVGSSALHAIAIGHPVVPFHRIIHQWALWTKRGDNRGAADGNSNRTLILFSLIHPLTVDVPALSELPQYCGLLMYNNVRWLMRGHVLCCSAECLPDILWQAVSTTVP